MFELNFLLSLYTVLVNKLGISIITVVLETIAEKVPGAISDIMMVLFHIKSLEFSFNKQFSALSPSGFRGATDAEGANSGFKRLPGYITTTH